MRGTYMDDAVAPDLRFTIALLVCDGFAVATRLAFTCCLNGTIPAPP